MLNIHAQHSCWTFIPDNHAKHKRNASKIARLDICLALLLPRRRTFTLALARTSLGRTLLRHALLDGLRHLLLHLRGRWRRLAAGAFLRLRRHRLLRHRLLTLWHVLLHPGIALLAARGRHCRRHCRRRCL